MSLISTNTLRYDLSGRKRKVAKSKKRRQSKFKESDRTKTLTYAQQRLQEQKKYRSAEAPKPSPNEGRLREKPAYSGSAVIGIAQMTKSNAVPVSSPEQAKHLSEKAQS